VKKEEYKEILNDALDCLDDAFPPELKPKKKKKKWWKTTLKVLMWVSIIIIILMISFLFYIGYTFDVMWY